MSWSPTMGNRTLGWARKNRIGRLAVSAVLAAGVLTPALGQDRTVTVTTRDGREITGQLVSDDAGVVTLSIDGIRTPISADRIARMRDAVVPADFYRQQRADLADDDRDGRLTLATELQQMGALDLAKRELDDLTQRFPGDERVARLARVVDAQVALQGGTSPRAGRPAETPRPQQAPGAAAAPNADEVPLLTDEQRNLLKVHEVDLSNEPSVRVPRETADEFFRTYGPTLPDRFRGAGGRRDFNRLPGYEQLRVMFDAQARDLYGQVVVNSEPEALREFRLRVNRPYIVGYFMRQFGELEGLELTAARPDAEPQAYTNFFLLDRFTYNGKRMIDRSAPEDSLLLQWGLPRDEARSPAPEEFEDWKPYFTSARDRRFTEMVDWVRSLYSPQPNYGIVYPPPAEDAPAEGSRAR